MNTSARSEGWMALKCFMVSGLARLIVGTGGTCNV